MRLQPIIRKIGFLPPPLQRRLWLSQGATTSRSHFNRTQRQNYQLIPELARATSRWLHVWSGRQAKHSVRDRCQLR